MNTIQLMSNNHSAYAHYKNNQSAKIALLLLHDSSVSATDQKPFIKDSHDVSVNGDTGVHGAPTFDTTIDTTINTSSGVHFSTRLHKAITLYAQMSPDMIVVHDIHTSSTDSFLKEYWSKKEPRIVFRENEFRSSIGALINDCMRSIDCDMLFVSWTYLNPYGMSFTQVRSNLALFSLCTVPLIENAEGKILPSVYKARKSLFGFKAELNKNNPMMPFTFLIHNYVGIYRKDLFDVVGGFDEDICDPYWQLYEFGMRSYANSEHIRMSPYFRTRAAKYVDSSTFLKLFFLQSSDFADRLLARLKTIGGIFLLESTLYVLLKLRSTKIHELTKTIHAKKLPRTVLKQAFIKNMHEYWV